MTFFLCRVRFHCQAIDSLRFPPYKAANLLRGALGTILPASVFAPKAGRTGPSGLEDQPRPFVFRAAHLDGTSISPGQPFHFDLNVFDQLLEVRGQLVEAVTGIVRRGIGPGRGRAELLDVTSEPIELRLCADPAPVPRITVRFVTPTELKDGGRIVTQPEFGILFARARDRISSLRAFYGPRPLDIDFRALGERAAQVRMTRCEIRIIDVQRRSSRTGQIHSLGGFVGEAGYEGALAEFVPFLEAAQFTGVGRQTVWGKGQLEICRA